MSFRSKSREKRRRLRIVLAPYFLLDKFHIIRYYFNMKQNVSVWIVIIAFLFVLSVFVQPILSADRVVSLTIKDTFSGDVPDGFASPGEEIALGIKLLMEFIPEDVHIASDTSFVRVKKGETQFYRSIDDTIINSSFEPTVFIKGDCPTDTILPLALVYRKDSVIDTLSLLIHTVATIDSCFLDESVNQTNSKLRIKVSAKCSSGNSSGYSAVTAKIKDAKGMNLGTIELFDDGKHSDKEKDDGLFAGNWWSPSSPEDYEIDLELKDSLTGNSHTIEGIAGFTTKSFALSNPYLIIGDPYSNTSQNESFQVISELMDSLSLNYSYWNVWFRDFPDSTEVEQWGRKGVIMIWATRLGGRLKYSAEGQKVVKDFLLGGGSLFLTTTYLGNYIEEYGNETDSCFYNDIICSKFIDRFSSGDSVRNIALLNPFTDDILDTFNMRLSLPYSNGFSSFADVIKPIFPATSVASPVLKKDSTIYSDTTVCLGLKVAKRSSRMIYLSFDVSDITPFSTRKDFFEFSLKWLGEEKQDTFAYESSADRNIELAKMKDPYPNPFISESTIPFTLLISSDVNLIVCDLSGRTVRYLIRSSLGQGNYYAVWDGRDEKGDGVSAGYYFVRLSTKAIEKKGGKEIEAIVSKKLLKLRK